MATPSVSRDMGWWLVQAMTKMRGAIQRDLGVDGGLRTVAAERIRAVRTNAAEACRAVYVAMARKKTTAGGFYSYISHGLGREVGIGTGYGAVLACSVFEAPLCGGFAYFLNLKLATYGINISWPWLALAMVVIISILAYFDIRLYSIVLGIGLISEIIMLLIFDGFMFAHGQLPWAAINPVNAFKALPASPGMVAGP